MAVALKVLDQRGSGLILGGLHPSLALLTDTCQMKLEVASLEARLCSSQSGSRGDFLFSLGTLEYTQFTKLPTDLQVSHVACRWPVTLTAVVDQSHKCAVALLHI